MKTRPMVVVGLVGMLGLLAGPVHAAEITVMGGMGVVSGLHDLAPAFEKMTGHKVIVRFEQTADINQKVNSGAPADIAALQPQQVDTFIKDGKMVAGTKTNFAQAGVGVAVKTGARRPDISTVEAFKTAMLKAKTKFIDGIPVAEVVAEGEVELGLQQINVILPVKGADYIGPLPKELQETVKFSAAVLTTSKQPEAAKAFLKFITSAEAAPLLRKSGMDPWH